MLVSVRLNETYTCQTLMCKLKELGLYLIYYFFHENVQTSLLIAHVKMCAEKKGGGGCLQSCLIQICCSVEEQDMFFLFK